MIPFKSMCPHDYGCWWQLRSPQKSLQRLIHKPNLSWGDVHHAPDAILLRADMNSEQTTLSCHKTNSGNSWRLFWKKLCHCQANNQQLLLYWIYSTINYYKQYADILEKIYIVIIYFHYKIRSIPYTNYKDKGTTSSQNQTYSYHNFQTIKHT